MAFRWLGSLGVVVALAVSCAGDDEKKVVHAEDAGAAGESGVSGSNSGGSSARPEAGAPSEAGSGGGSSDGGEPANNGGQPGTAGQPATEAGAGGALEVGGAAGAGGSSNPEPVSACGEGNYQDSAAACQVCPAKPEPNYPTSIGCYNFAFANYNAYDGWLDLAFDTTIYEAFFGDVSISWLDEDDTPGDAQTTWSYQGVQGNSHVFRIPIETAPETAKQFSITYWAFPDACQFNYYAASLVIEWDGVESWQLINCG